jgi:tRNA A-37 threonylcarbamoyl transferase component Bud32
MPALVVAHQKGRLWNAAVATIFEEESVDAGAWLQSSPSATRLLAAAAAAGNAIRRFHDAGGCHRDLHVGNLLVRERAGQTEIIVIDLDGAKVLPSVSPARRMRELMRLHRSLIKRGWATTLGPRVYAEFFKAYTQGDHPLRRELLRHHPRERFRLALHVAGYKIRERSLNA